jgi:hypothetical protein
MKKMTNLPRRRFLGMTMVAGLTPAMSKASSISSLFTETSEAKAWQGLTYEQFNGMVGQRFELQREDKTAITVELVQVDKLSAKSRPAWLPRKQPFNARFRAVGERGDSSLDDVVVVHRKLGACKLLLNEIPTSKGISIETIFA